MYNGRGGRHGEGVYVDGQLAGHNPRLWFGPVLVFPLGSRLAAIENRHKVDDEKTNKPTLRRTATNTTSKDGNDGKNGDDRPTLKRRDQ